MNKVTKQPNETVNGSKKMQRNKFVYQPKVAFKTTQGMNESSSKEQVNNGNTGEVRNSPKKTRPVQEDVVSTTKETTNKYAAVPALAMGRPGDGPGQQTNRGHQIIGFVQGQI